jgi:organic radical activating enzyme
VLSLPDHYLPGPFFAERLTLKALAEIGKDARPLLPPGYFNGLAHPRSGRHFYSTALQRFYLEEHFETLFASPRSLAVNVVSQCNYQCRKCQYHSPDNREKRFLGPIMSVDEMRKLLDLVSDYPNLASVAPTISGEPLLHPDIAGIVALIKKRGYACGFATNASLLTRELGKKLLDAGVDDLAFSVDADESGLYARLQGGDLDRVERNILAFQEESIKKRGRFSGSMICVYDADNVSRLENYRERWLKRGFSVIFSARHDVRGNWKPFAVDQRWLPPHNTPCKSPWHTLLLDSQGRATLCCLTCAAGQTTRESIFTAGAEEIWRVDMLRNWRKTLLAQRPPLCKEDLSNLGLSLTWIHEGGRTKMMGAQYWTEPYEPPRSGETAAGPRRALGWAKSLLPDRVRARLKTWLKA